MTLATLLVYFPLSGHDQLIPLILVYGENGDDFAEGAVTWEDVPGHDDIADPDGAGLWVLEAHYDENTVEGTWRRPTAAELDDLITGTLWKNTDPS